MSGPIKPVWRPLPFQRWAVPVRLPFTHLVLSGACSPKAAWLLSRGARTSPFQQSVILHSVKKWKMERDGKARKYLGRFYKLFQPEYVVEVRRNCRIPTTRGLPSPRKDGCLDSAGGFPWFASGVQRKAAASPCRFTASSSIL